MIRLQGIEMAFDGEAVLRGINLDIHDREFVTLLGPSGCGKTTTLRIIGGFVTPDAGEVLFEGVRINELPPYKRPVNTIFQRYALFPHLNVFENVAFGMRVKKLPDRQVRQTVGEMLELVGLRGFESRRVHNLSGGQQQRVAIARALANRPRTLLLDEPLGALDLKLRKEMQIELKRIQRELDITFVYVTHDQEEALTMSDTVVVMNGGVILQIGTPQDIYNEPECAFVADFIGESNIIDGMMKRDHLAEFAGRAHTCVDGGFLPDEKVDVVIRPEDIRLIAPADSGLTGIVESVIFKGVHYEMIIDAVGMKWIVQSTAAQEVGAVVGMTFSPGDIHIMRKGEAAV